MDRSKEGLAGEWETLKELLPDFTGKRTLDLGCGYGWHCIYAVEHGAASAAGIDISHKMLEVAGEKLLILEPRTGIAASMGRSCIFRWTTIITRVKGQ